MRVLKLICDNCGHTLIYIPLPRTGPGVGLPVHCGASKFHHGQLYFNGKKWSNGMVNYDYLKSLKISEYSNLVLLDDVMKEVQS